MLYALSYVRRSVRPSDRPSVRPTPFIIGYSLLQQIAIELIKESSKAVGSIASSLLFPIFPFVLQLSLFSGWASTMLYLASSTKPIFVGT